MSYIILAINPGSTSTKIAVYEDTQPVLSLAINHSAAEIAAFATIGDQFEWRKDLVLESLRKRGFDIGTLSAVIGRGGLVHPVEGGVYEVNDALHDDLLHARRQHASNLGGLIAQEIAAEVGVKAYIADPVVVDEMIPYARISGLPQLPRESVFHALNQKAIARRYARETGRKYEELNLIVSHMGGGITVSAHRQGRVIDTSNALNGAGPFSPERAGTLPPGPLIDLCFSGEYTREELQKLINGRGGLLAHLGTTSVPEILRRIDNNDLQAMLVLRAMCYNVAKEIGAMAIALKGKADAILLTGGIAHNKPAHGFHRRACRLHRPGLRLPRRERVGGVGTQRTGRAARRLRGEDLLQSGRHGIRPPRLSRRLPELLAKFREPVLCPHRRKTTSTGFVP